MADESMTYAQAGVDIDAATTALKNVGDAIRASHNDRVIGGIGSFGALFDARFPEMERPVLVSSIDGVGTKTKIAAMVGDYSGIGHDIVNHCINDILCQGARPLFFLDYFGCARLQPDAFQQVVAGAAAACAAQGCALIGGETAEMPGVYNDDEVDVVGAIVGIVDDAQRLPSAGIDSGDVLIGLASSGLHTNGYSMARRAFFDVQSLSVRDALPGGMGETVGEALLAPHRCYAASLLPLVREGHIKGLAHITGGGLVDNLPRILPGNVEALIHRDRWTVPRLFQAIAEIGQVSHQEMFRTFNMGIGMVAVLSASHAAHVRERLLAAGEEAVVIGELRPGSGVQIV